MNESRGWRGWPAAVWQCPTCQRIQTLTYYGGFTQYTVNRWCGCIVLADYGYVSHRRMSRLVPLNDLARNHEACEDRYNAKREAARQRAEEELKNWPPAPGFRQYWNTQ